ncbi:MAG: hypothetical protein ACRC6V_05615 [Bacteroidales bacterium]
MMNTRVKGIVGTEAPFVSTDGTGHFQVGDPVQIRDTNSMSHMTQGVIKDIIYRGSEVQPLILVHWLENAPPIRIGMDKVNRLKPIKFWMVAGDVSGDFVREDDNENVRNGSIAPAKKFFTEAAAVSVAERMKVRYRRNYIILEAVKYVTMDNNNLNSL